MADLSDAITPASVVERLQERGIHLSERTLRDFARKVGACRIIGKAMFFMPEDIEVLIAAAKPHPKGATSPPTLGSPALLKANRIALAADW